MGKYELIQGDFVKWLGEYDPNKDGYFHALFADPPYGLIENSKRFSSPDAAPVQYGRDGAFQRQAKGFMGQTWDGFESLKDYQEWVTSWASQLHRVMLPGAVVGLFGGSRTWHRLAVGLEDAGLEIFDVVMWIYGSGLPKSYNIGKGIDKRMGQVAPKEKRVRTDGKPVIADESNGDSVAHQPMGNMNLSRPAISELGKAWENHGTLLKPGYEPVIFARLPRNGATFIDLALKHGTGSINIQAGRIPSDEQWTKGDTPDIRGGKFIGHKETIDQEREGSEDGRFPSNVVLTHSPNCTESACSPDCPVYQMDEQSGVSESGGQLKNRSAKRSSFDGNEFRFGAGVYNAGYEDKGGASRFFFTGKAATWERHLPGYLTPSPELTEDELHYFQENIRIKPVFGDDIYNAAEMDQHLLRYCIPAKATHPTMKPLELTAYFAGLVLPPQLMNGTTPRRILIPFAGVGSEMIGALLAGWDSVTGIELTDAYIPQAQARLSWWSNHLSYDSAQNVYNQNRKGKNKGRKQRESESESGVRSLSLFD